VFKRLGYGFVGLVFMAVAGYAASIPLLTGPLDPSSTLGTLNQLIQSINSNIQNKLFANGIASPTGTGTTEQTLYTYTLPANYLANAGDSIRAECSASTAATANNKTLTLYFGASTVTTGAVASNNSNLYLTYTVTRGASSTAQVFVGNGMGGTGGATPVAVVNTAGTDDMTTALVIKCTATDAVSAAADVNGRMMIVESLK
jgi:hypothetical protein